MKAPTIVQVKNGLLTLEDIMNTKALAIRKAKANYGTFIMAVLKYGCVVGHVSRTIRQPPFSSQVQECLLL